MKTSLRLLSTLLVIVAISPAGVLAATSITRGARLCLEATSYCGLANCDGGYCLADGDGNFSACTGDSFLASSQCIGL